MDSINESLASWATMLGAIVGLLGLIQSRLWLTVVGGLFVVASIAAALYARSARLRIQSAAINVDGRSLDSLNIANLSRRINRSLAIQEANQLARIQGEDLTLMWRYDGYCRAEQEATIEFSVDTDSNVPSEQLQCFAYDLRQDPARKHKIQPMLVGADGISKKIAVPFLRPLVAQQPFSVLLNCELPGCMKTGLEYYTSTMSLKQHNVEHVKIRLIFERERPVWVRVYTFDLSGRTSLLKDLSPFRAERNVTEYVDLAENVTTPWARIYLFRRDLSPAVSDIARLQKAG